MEKELQDHITSEQARLDRIESKIDKLSDAVISIARAEEKLANLQSDHLKLYDRMNRFSEKLDCIETSVVKNESAVKLINFLLGTIVVAVAGALTTMWFN